jgi:hypothetical protein
MLREYLHRNGNGMIDSGHELFGVDTIKSNDALATNGFNALSNLDSNGDHVFDQNDGAMCACANLA